MRLNFGFVAATGIAVFSVVASIWGMDDKVATSFPWLSPALPWMPPIAIISLLIALAFLFFDLIAKLIFVLIVAPSAVQKTACVAAQERDLQSICEIADREIGGTTSYADTLALYRHNKDIFRKIIDTGTHETIGYFCVLPLTNRGLDRVKERNLLASPIDYACFAKTFRKGGLGYIGGIAGINRRGKAGAYEQLKLFILNKKIVEAYARPMTKRGVQLVKENSFKPVDENDRIAEGVYVFKVRDI